MTMKLSNKLVADITCIHDITAIRNKVVKSTKIDCFMCNVKGIGSLGVVEVKSKNGNPIFKTCPLCGGKSYIAL
jgi:hypothetical protein